MALTPGTRLGLYDIVAALGAGGMGEVYQARDTRLDRDVAIKVLPEMFASDPDRAARFEREAKVLAALNHPGVAAIYGLDHDGDTAFLILELVPGETLADRIARGPLPLGEALGLARQLADAIEAAHERGIVHRDLKPANIKVTDDDKVKVLDFGLAKAFATDPEQSGSVSGLSAAPTITTPAQTRLGVVLGTAAYMAPEQARGKNVDKRADIWAFGCVLYEMLSGRRPFLSGEVSDTLALVLTKEPEWSVLPASTPRPLLRLIHRCLEKDRSRRLADIADARLDIDEALATPAGGHQTAPASSRSWLTKSLPWAIAALSLAMAGALLFWAAPWREVPAAPAARVKIDLGLADVPSDVLARTVAFTPDGSTLVFSTNTGLFVRRLNQLQATFLEGTAGGEAPFISPSGSWIAFFAGGKLKKVRTDGGAVVAICDAAAFRGGTWLDEETIVFQAAGNVWDQGPLLRVAAAGGKPEPIPSTKEAVPQRWPQVLPGGRALLVTVPAGVTQRNFIDASIGVQPLPDGPLKTLTEGYFGRYVPSGHLLFMRDGTLFAVPFDVERLELAGAPVPVLTGVRAQPSTGAAMFTVSASGRLAYLEGDPATATEMPIHWLDRSGKTTPIRGQPASWGAPALSPDGKRIALMMSDAKQNIDIWTYDIERESLNRLTTHEAADANPIWSPDGQWIAYGSRRANRTMSNIFAQRADGTGSVVQFTDMAAPQLPDAWHPSGKVIVFHEGNPNSARQNLGILPLEGDSRTGWKPGKPSVFLGGEGLKANAAFSPDGNWIAYANSEGGRFELFVRPFPGPGGQWQISSGGAAEARWSRTRPEIVFREGAGQQVLSVARYTVNGDVFAPEKPQPWSKARLTGPPLSSGVIFDLHPDGERVVAALAPEVRDAPLENRAVVVFNFFDELKAIAPPTK